jgi:RNA polymerase sigma factor (sigma-70 family)
VISLTEESLWTEYWETKGDAERNALVEFYLPGIKADCDALRRSINPAIERAEALTYACIAVIEHAIPKFDPNRAPDWRPFARQIIRNALIDHNESISRAAKIGSVKPDSLDNLTARESEPVVDQMDEFNILLEDLPDSLQVLVESRIMNGLTFQETGDRMGISPPEVYRRLNRALEIVRKKIEARSV